MSINYDIIIFMSDASGAERPKIQPHLQFSDVAGLLQKIQQGKPTDILPPDHLRAYAQRANNNTANAIGRNPDSAVSITASSYIAVGDLELALGNEDQEASEVIAFLRKKGIGQLSRSYLHQIWEILPIASAIPQERPDIKLKFIASMLKDSSTRGEDLEQKQAELAAIFWLLDQRGVRMQSTQS
jgi:hypothetical protein